VDWVGNKHKVAFPVKKLDLTSPTDLEVLWAVLHEDGLAMVWLAPLCGTFSRAREKLLPTWAA
jgi:hypothetical protein